MDGWARGEREDGGVCKVGRKVGARRRKRGEKEPVRWSMQGEQERSKDRILHPPARNPPADSPFLSNHATQTCPMGSFSTSAGTKRGRYHAPCKPHIPHA